MITLIAQRALNAWPLEGETEATSRPSARVTTLSNGGRREEAALERWRLWVSELEPLGTIGRLFGNVSWLR
jgi:hypothetical protein